MEIWFLDGDEEMDLRLLTGASIIWLGVVGCAVCYLGARNPRQPKWAKEFFMANIIIPAIVGGLVVGPMLFIEYFILNFNDLKIFDLLVAGLIVASSYAVVKLMRIGKRVAEYEKQGGSFNDRFTSPKGGAIGTQAA